MKLLLDSCVWGKAAAPLRDAGHNVIYAGDWSPDPGDEAILAVAVEQERVVVTLDKDFGTLAFLKKQPHCGIIRLVDIAATRQATACLSVISLYATALEQHAIVTSNPAACASERHSARSRSRSAMHRPLRRRPHRSAHRRPKPPGRADRPRPPRVRSLECKPRTGRTVTGGKEMQRANRG